MLLSCVAMSLLVAAPIIRSDIPAPARLSEQRAYSISGKDLMSRFSSYHSQDMWLVDSVQAAADHAYAELSANQLLRRHLPALAFDATGGHCTNITTGVYNRLFRTLEQKNYLLKKIHTRNFGANRCPRPPHHDFLMLQSKIDSQETWILDACYKQFLKFDSVSPAQIALLPDVMLIRVDNLASLHRLLNLHQLPKRFWHVWEDAYMGSPSTLDDGMAESQARKARRY